MARMGRITIDVSVTKDACELIDVTESAEEAAADHPWDDNLRDIARYLRRQVERLEARRDS